jgi:hypothetical protein
MLSSATHLHASLHVDFAGFQYAVTPLLTRIL